MTSEAIGKTYPPTVYAVGREKIREFALAVGETEPLHLDVAAARGAGHADVVAPPMFAVVYCAPALGPALLDPEVGIDFARMVHGAQEFAWGPLVVAGDEITTVVTVADIRQERELGFYVFGSESRNERGDVVCTGTWTNIVRGTGS